MIKMMGRKKGEKRRKKERKKKKKGRERMSNEKGVIGGEKT